MKYYLMILLLLMVVSTSSVDSNVYFNRIVDSIYKAEGSTKATYAYGVKSVKYSSIEEARHICYNTVLNNHQRWQDKGSHGDFLIYLSKVYCPIDSTNWLHNVRYFLDKSSK